MSRTSLQRRHPAVGVALGAAAVEALGGQQRGPVGRHRLRGGDDGGVGEDPAGRDVALLGDLVAGLPQRAYGAERPPAADPVQARTYGATRRRAGSSSKLRRWSNSWRAHSALPAASSSAASSVAQLDEHLDVEGGVLEPRLGQRPGRPVDGRVLLGQPVAEQRLDQGGQADPRVAEQAAGELGVEQPGRAAGRPR